MAKQFNTHLNDEWSEYHGARRRMAEKTPLFWHPFTKPYKSMESLASQVASIIYNPLSMGLQAALYLVEAALYALKSLVLVPAAVMGCLTKDHKMLESLKESVAKTLVLGMMTVVSLTAAVLSILTTPLATITRGVVTLGETLEDIVVPNRVYSRT